MKSTKQIIVQAVKDYFSPLKHWWVWILIIIVAGLLLLNDYRIYG